MAAIDSYKQLSLKIFKIKPARIDIIIKDQKSGINDTNQNNNNNNNNINNNNNYSNNKFL